MQILGIATPVPTARQLSRSFPEVFQAPHRMACLAPALLRRTCASARDPSAGERLETPEGRRRLLGAPPAPLHRAMDTRCRLLLARRGCSEAGSWLSATPRGPCGVTGDSLGARGGLLRPWDPERPAGPGHCGGRTAGPGMPGLGGECPCRRSGRAPAVSGPSKAAASEQPSAPPPWSCEEGPDEPAGKAGAWCDPGRRRRRARGRRATAARGSSGAAGGAATSAGGREDAGHCEPDGPPCSGAARAPEPRPPAPRAGEAAMPVGARSRPSQPRLLGDARESWVRVCQVTSSRSESPVCPLGTVIVPVVSCL